MEQELAGVLVQKHVCDKKNADEVAAKVKEWVEDADRAVTCSIHVPGKLVIAKLESKKLIGIVVSESTNSAGAAIVKPEAPTFVVKFPIP